MSFSIEGLKTFSNYINQLMDKADHHAFNVNEIVLAIAGAVLWKGEDLKVLVREGDIKNTIWFNISGKRYALKYSHEDSDIKLHRGSLQGRVIAIFNNSSPVSFVKQTFDKL